MYNTRSRAVKKLQCSATRAYGDAFSVIHSTDNKENRIHRSSSSLSSKTGDPAGTKIWLSRTKDNIVSEAALKLQVIKATHGKARIAATSFSPLHETQSARCYR